MKKGGSSQRTVEPFSQQRHENSGFLALTGKPIAMGMRESLNQSVGAELAQVVANGAGGVLGSFEFKGIQDGGAQFLGIPAAQGTGASAQQDLEQARHSDLVQANAGDLAFLEPNGFGQTGQKIELAMDIEVGRLVGSKSIQDSVAGGADLIQAIQALSEVEVGKVIGNHFQSQVSAPLLVLFDKAVLPIGAEDVPAVLNLFQNSLQFAVEVAGNAVAKDLSNAIGRKAVEAQLAAALKDVPNGPVALENHVPTIFDLLDGPGTSEALTGASFLLGEFRPQSKGPITESLPDDFGIQTVGGSLERFGIGNGSESVVRLGVGDAVESEITSDELMSVDVGGDLKREEGTDPQSHGSQDGVVDIEVIVTVATELRADHPVVGILSGMAELDGAEGASLLHIHEDVIDPKALGPASPFQSWTDDLLMAEGFAFSVAGNPDQRDLGILCVAFDPADVLGGALSEDRLGDDGLSADLLEKDHDVAFGAEEIQVAVDHDAIEGVIYELNP